jgi:1-acyl-sn-glycerol-3-phosphate acyltransferase
VNNTNRPFPFFISILLTLIGYCVYFTSILIFLCLVVPCIPILSFHQRAKAPFVRKLFKRYLFLLAHKVLPGLQIYSISEISGFLRHTGNPAVYIANHRGRLDALLLLSIIEDAGVVIKSKYCRLPFYSALVKHFDFIAVSSDAPHSLSQAFDRGKELLMAGKNILIFPEGTRASSGRLLPFKEFAFRLASETKVPLIPVIIHSNCPFLAKLPGSIFPGNKVRFTIRCLEAHYHDDKEIPALCASRLRARMANELKTLDQGTLWERMGNGPCPTPQRARKPHEIIND